MKNIPQLKRIKFLFFSDLNLKNNKIDYIEELIANNEELIANYESNKFKSSNNLDIEENELSKEDAMDMYFRIMDI